jgi:uncharacterized membrane protein YhdT
LLILQENVRIYAQWYFLLYKGENDMELMTSEQKHKQILKEVKATFILIAIVAAWHIGFAFILEDIDFLICGMPLWFFVSTIGAFVISVIGVILLLKKVFKNFDLGNELEESEREGANDK